MWTDAQRKRVKRMTRAELEDVTELLAMENDRLKVENAKLQELIKQHTLHSEPPWPG